MFVSFKYIYLYTQILITAIYVERYFLFKSGNIKYSTTNAAMIYTLRFFFTILFLKLFLHYNNENLE